MTRRPKNRSEERQARSRLRQRRLDRLVAALAAAPEGLSRRELQRDVFKGALAAAEVALLVRSLRRDGRAEVARVWRTDTIRRKVEVVRARGTGPPGSAPP